QGSLMLLDCGGQIGFGSRAGDEVYEETFVEDRIGVGEAAVAPYLWRRGIKRLDWIAASHGHPDHAGGFAEIARGFEIAAALEGVSGRSESTRDLFGEAVAACKAPLRKTKRGDSIVIDGVSVEALAPFAGP